jgi:hypothetical protein
MGLFQSGHCAFSNRSIQDLPCEFVKFFDLLTAQTLPSTILPTRAQNIAVPGHLFSLLAFSGHLDGVRVEAMPAGRVI